MDIFTGNNVRGGRGWGKPLRWIYALAVWALLFVSSCAFVLHIAQFMGRWQSALLAGGLALAGASWLLAVAREDGRSPKSVAGLRVMMLAGLYVFAWLSVCASGLLWQRRYASVQAKLVELGYPRSLSEIKSCGGKGKPDLYAAARRMDLDGFRALHNKRAVEPPAFGRQTPESLKYAAEMSSYFRTYLDGIVLPALASGPCIDSVDYGRAAKETFDYFLPQYGHLVNTQRALLYRAMSASVRNDMKGAWTSLEQALDMTALGYETQLFLSQIVITLMYDEAASAASGILLAHPGESMPGSVAGKLRAAAARDNSYYALRAEIVFHEDVLRSRVADSFSPNPRKQSTALMIGALGTLELSYEWRLAESFRGDLDRNPGISAMRVEMRAKETRLMLPLAGGGFSPEYERIYYQELRGRAHIRMTLLASALNAYNRARGRYPASLDELVPAYADKSAMKSPFRDGAIAYQQLEGGKKYRLYDPVPPELRSAVDTDRIVLE